MRSPGGDSHVRARRQIGAGGTALLVAAAAGWTTVVASAAARRHDQFLSHRFDLGNMVQAVWSTTQGRPLEMTDGATGDQVTRLGAHVDPILALVAPLWWLHPDPHVLLVLQAAVLAAGVYPAVRLALKYTESNLIASIVGAWYLAFPWIVWSAFDDFHPVTLAISLLLYAIWFLDDERFWWFALFSGLAMLTGELVGLTVAGVGLWYALSRRRLAQGGVIAIAGAGWTATCLLVIVPAFNDGRPSRYYDRFESVGGSPSGLLRTMFTDPHRILEHVTEAGDLWYLLWLLAPTAFLALLAPLLLVATLPQLGVNLLAEWSTITLPMFHYVAAVVPILVVATVMGLARLPPRGRVLGAGAALGVSALILVSYPPRPGAQAFVFPEQFSPDRRTAMREALALVPPGVAVTATNRLGAHLSDRRVIHLLPWTEGAEWAVIDIRNPWLPDTGEAADPRRFVAVVESKMDDRGWALVFDRAGIRVYRRVGQSPPESNSG